MANNTDKESLTAWVTTEEKNRWRQLAHAAGMTTSAYTRDVVYRILKETLSRKEAELIFKNVPNSEESKVPIRVRFTQSEAKALEQVAGQRDQSRQNVIAAAVREFLLREPQIDEKNRTMIIDSTLAVNKIGINLNQIARVLNAQNKSGQIDWKSVEETLSVVRKVDEKVLLHIKAIEDFLNKHYRRLKVEESNDK